MATPRTTPHQRSDNSVQSEHSRCATQPAASYERGQPYDPCILGVMADAPGGDARVDTRL
jgi:hypothetical protein